MRDSEILNQTGDSLSQQFGMQRARFQALGISECGSKHGQLRALCRLPQRVNVTHQVHEYLDESGFDLGVSHVFRRIGEKVQQPRQVHS